MLARLTILLALVLCTYGTNAAPIILNDDDSVIVEFKLGRHILSDAMLAFHVNNETYILFEDFVEALDYAISIENAEGIADGWFVNELNTFQLNLDKQEVYIKGEKRQLSKEIPYARDDFGFYLNIGTLAEWFGLELSFQMARLQINASSDIPQPIEQRIIREKSRKQASVSVQPQNKSRLIENTYRALGPISIDGQSSLSFDNDEIDGAFSFLSVGDLMFHEVRLNYSHVSSENDIRLSLQKDGSSPDKPIGLGISHYRMGDIYAPGTSLIHSGVSGVGVYFNNYSDKSLEQSFSQRDFEGEAPPGWEVELYRNNIFVDMKVVGADGRYLFNDIALQFGNNIFEIRKYGPQGQSRVEKESVKIGSNQMPPDTFKFEGSLLVEEESLFNDPASPQSNNTYISLSSLYGLADQHTVGAGLFASPNSSTDQTQAHHFGKLNWFSSYELGSFRVGAVQDLYQSGSAYEFEMVGQWRNYDYTIESEWFEGLISKESNQGRKLNEASIKVFGTLDTDSFKTVAYSFTGTRSESVDHDRTYSLNNDFSVLYRDLRFSNSITSNYSNRSSMSTTTGRLSMNQLNSGVQLRGNINYRLNNPDITSFSVSGTLKKGKWRYHGFTDVGFGEDALATVGLDGSYQLGNFSLSMAMQFNSDHELTSNLSINFGGFFNPDRFSTSLRKHGLSNQGNVDVRVFLDRDNDGIYTSADDPIKGAALKGRSAWRNTYTDEEGKAILSGISKIDGTLIKLDSMSLDDPYLKTLEHSYQVIGHSGSMIILDIPVVQTTEIEGNLIVSESGYKRGAGGVPVSLFSGDKLVQTTTTEFDGYFFFEKVLPGNYHINIIDPNNTMSRYTWSPSEPFNTDIESGIKTVPDFILHKGIIDN